MKLSIAFDDYCLLKIKLLLSLLDAKLVIELKSEDELVDLHATRGMVFESEEGVIKQHLAILKFIAGQFGSSSMLTDSTIDQAQNEQWLEFSWREVGET